MDDNKLEIQGHLKDEFVYLAALSILRSLYGNGVASLEFLDRINQKNAEKMNCAPIEIA